MPYYQCLTITTRISLVVNIIVERLDINGALSILIWVKPLFYLLFLKCEHNQFISFVLNSTTIASVSANINHVPILNGTNFKYWKENIDIILGYMDMDLALRTKQPTTPTTSSTSKDIRHYEKWGNVQGKCF